jgi:hypothetical protein
MNFSLRASAAALALIAPLAAFVATPAQAQSQRAVVAGTVAPDYHDHGSRWERRRDHRAPEIFDITPAQGERVGERGRTRISARVADQGSGIGQVSLRIDGRDVSDAVRFDGQELRFRDDLARGRHTADLVVRDRAGNATRRTWTFDVVGERYGYNNEPRYGYNNAPQRW